MSDAERLLSAREVAARLGVSLATFYRLAFFKTRKVRVAPMCVRYRASDVAHYTNIAEDAA